MREVREQFILRLQNDSELIDMLPPQPNWAKEKSNPQKKWSVMPLDGLTEANAKLRKVPLITVQMGNDNQADYHLLETFVYVRCYNGKDKAYVTIDDILSRVKVLLHRNRFEYAGSVSIETLYETTGPELIDQAYDLKYREARYRLLRI